MRRTFALLSTVATLLLSYNLCGTPERDLRYACSRGKTRMVARLMSGNADINGQNREGAACLHMAAIYGHDHLITYLAKHYKARVNFDITDNKQQTALHHAAKRGFTRTVRALLNAGADRSLEDRFGMLPSFYAGRRGYVATLRVLITPGTINLKNRSGDVLLHYTVSGKSLACLNAVLDAGAYLRAKNIGGWTPLHVAARHNFVEGIKALRRAGARLNSIDSGHWTPLHVAAYFGNYDAAQSLVELGAETHLKTMTSGGRSAAEIARRHHHYDLAELLESAERQN